MISSDTKMIYLSYETHDIPSDFRLVFLLWCYDSQQVKPNQPLEVFLLSPPFLTSLTTEDFMREREHEKECGMISMQQTVCCISAVLMRWSRPGQRQTAISSASLLCTHQGLCRGLRSTMPVKEKQDMW